MNLNLLAEIYSRPETWLTIMAKRGSGEQPDLYIRSMHGNADPREVFQVIPLRKADGKPVEYRISANHASVQLLTDEGAVELLFDREGLLRIRAAGGGVRLYREEPKDSGYKADYPFVHGDRRIQVNAFRSRKQYMITALHGRFRIEAPWEEVTCPTMALDFLPIDGEEAAELVFDSFDASWEARTYADDFDGCRAEADLAFRQWLAAAPPGDAGLPEVRELAAYTHYVSLVPPSGMLKRLTMLISPGFNGVWSWDHCFNAIALAGRDPQMAWDQLMVPFDRQDEFGALPDYVKDTELVWNFTKPPIHGWTLRRMLERMEEGGIDSAQLEAFYPKLSAWTEWWFGYRDFTGSGFPQYQHGNDSGWDNALIFAEPGAVEAPDLSAFLVVQMDVLAELAVRIGKPEEARVWTERADALLAGLLDRFWNGEKFIARRNGSGEIIDTQSLLHWIPVILGRRLPQAVREQAVRMLGPDGPFLTEWGPATEAPSSPHYRPNGYWRGPIWAPSTFLLADGLRDAGETELAAEIARRFCRLCGRGGMAENFDALTGEGQKDRFHTWPASVFQLFVEDYLSVEGRGSE